MYSHIVEEMLRKAEEAEKAGDDKLAKHWLARAEEAEKIISKVRADNEISRLSKVPDKKQQN